VHSRTTLACLLESHGSSVPPADLPYGEYTAVSACGRSLDLARPIKAGVECLRGRAVAPQAVRVEQIASLFGERQAQFAPAKIDGLDKALVAEVPQRIVLGVEVLFRHDSERADDGQRVAVLAIQFVHTVAIENELAFLAAWQIEVVNERVARVVIVSVQLAVDAGAAIARDPGRRTLADRSIGRQASALLLRTARAGWVIREDALAVSARGCSGKRRGAGACRRGG
jgi:hypothetical protein